jgi:hypothetical protein
LVSAGYFDIPIPANTEARFNFYVTGTHGPISYMFIVSSEAHGFALEDPWKTN